jgi:predicted phosphodiesterase
MRPKYIVFVLVIFALCSVAEAAPSISKGPYVILNSSGQRVVKVRSGEKQLFLEYQLPGGKNKIEAMEGVGGGVFEDAITNKALSYRISDGDGATEWFALKRLPTKGAKYSFLLYGDNRTGDGSREVHRRLVKLMTEEDAEFVVHVGDLVGKGGNEHQWSKFFDDAGPLFEKMPFVASIGNHDKSKNGWFSRYFRASGDEEYMAIPVAGGWFLLLDSVIPVSRDDEQYNYLKRMLKDMVGSSPIIASMHVPPFSSGKHGSHREVIENWVPLFEEYGVDLVVGGHDHDYQRIGPTKQVLYLVSGGGGAPIYKVKKGPEVDYYYDGHHYVLIEVDGKKLRGWMKGENGQILDRFSLEF